MAYRRARVVGIRSQTAVEKRAAKKKATASLKRRICDVHGHTAMYRRGIRLLADGTPLNQHELIVAQDRMLQSGWCTHQVRHLSQKYNSKTLLYMSALTRPPLRTINHQRCLSTENCVAYNTNSVTYESQHTMADCRCTTVCVPYDSLLKVIRAGRVPLISFGERLELKVEARNSTSTYVAITHVWADGLGNPRINGLPYCQIQRLESSLKGLQQVC
jgi:hypothetical protein